MNFLLKIIITIKHYIKKLKRKSVILQKDNNPIQYNDGIIYQGNPEIGLANIEIKLERVKQGGVFEHPNMIATNNAIAKYFIKDGMSVINIGSGTATLEYYNHKKYPKCKFLACEMDKKTTAWVKDNRQMPNVICSDEDMTSILKKYPNKFDIAITVDAIEHIKDYKSFLDEFSQLSDKAVISTPNRDRYTNKEDLIKPPYKYHTHEFNAGELYFILKMYYKTVKLYSPPEEEKPLLKEVGIYSNYYKLIAYCEK